MSPHSRFTRAAINTPMTSNGACAKTANGGRSSPTPKLAVHSVGVCIEESLQEYRLRISGNGGCTMFLEGKPARAKGSSHKPPTKLACALRGSGINDV